MFVYLWCIGTNNIMKTTITEMISTGLYNEVALAKFHAKQVKANNGSIEMADVMVRIYKHNFLIRVAK
jgi:hypothetical protein